APGLDQTRYRFAVGRCFETDDLERIGTENLVQCFAYSIQVVSGRTLTGSNIEVSRRRLERALAREKQQLVRRAGAHQFDANLIVGDRDVGIAHIGSEPTCLCQMHELPEPDFAVSREGQVLSGGRYAARHRTEAKSDSGNSKHQLVSANIASGSSGRVSN